MKKVLAVLLVVVMIAGAAPFGRYNTSLSASAITSCQEVGTNDTKEELSDFEQGYLGVVLSLIYAPMKIAARFPAAIDFIAPVIALPSWLLASILIIPLLIMGTEF